jgi:hypothetical protein
VAITLGFSFTSEASSVTDNVFATSGMISIVGTAGRGAQP